MFSAAVSAQSSSEAMCSTAAYYLALGDYARALRALPSVTTAGESGAAQNNLRGVTEMMNGRIEKALELFDAALATDAGFDGARFNRGIALLKLKRYGDAAAAFHPLAESKDNSLSAAAAYHLALAADRAGEPAKAETWLNQALQDDPDLDSAVLYLGAVREQQKKFAAAGEAYKEYMRRHPESVVAMLRFGITAHRAGHTEVARKHLQQVVALAPGSAEAVEARKFLVMWN